MLCVRRWSDVKQACSSGVGKYNAESPKLGSKRFNSITKTIYFAHLCILVIYDRVERALWMYSYLSLMKMKEKMQLRVYLSLMKMK